MWDVTVHFKKLLQVLSSLWKVSVVLGMLEVIVYSFLEASGPNDSVSVIDGKSLTWYSTHTPTLINCIPPE